MRLVGIMLVVFVKKDICSHIYNMESSTVGTGLMGMMVSENNSQQYLIQ